MTVAASRRPGLVAPDIPAHVRKARAVAQLGDVPGWLVRVVGTREPLELVRANHVIGHRASLGTAAWVIGVLDALGVERCVLAGESQGGAIAQYAAARQPSRFDGLVLSAPTPTGRREGGTAFPDLCRSDYPAAVASFVEQCFPEADSDHIKRWGRNILLRAEGDQAARILEMWRDEDVPDVDPRQIEIPTVALHGSADPIVSIDVSRRLAELLPDVEFVEFDGVGHVPTMTRPDEVVAAILHRFA